MSNNREQIIHQTKLFGIEVYKRSRIEELEIQVTARQNIAEYPGLLVASHHLPFSSSNPSWEMMAHRSIELTLLNLIINELAELAIFTDTEHYLNNLIRREYKNYRLVIKNKYLGEDILSLSILNAIKSAEQNKSKKANLKIVIRHLLNEYFGEYKAYKRPQKEFIIKLFQEYSQKYPWMTLKVQERRFFQNQLELDMTQKKQEELKNAHQVLSDTSLILKRQSRVLFLYTNEFHRAIHLEFRRRFKGTN